MKSGIYMILNIINNKRYIGSSKNILKRWEQHKKQLRQDKHYNIYLQNSYNKYGSSSFKYSILELVSEELLTEKENYWCNLFKTHNSDKGYNIATIVRGGEVSMNYVVSQREKCQNKKKVWLTDKKGTILNVFRSHAEAARELSTTESHIHFLTKGKVAIFKKDFFLWDSLIFTDEKIKKRNNRRKVVSDSPYYKQVYQFDLEGNFLNVYTSLKEAILLFKNKSIRNCAIGKQKSAAGFLWSYTNSIEVPKYTRDNFKIYQYSLDKELLKIFNTPKEAAEQTGSKIKGIQKVLYGERKSHNNFIWSRTKF